LLAIEEDRSMLQEGAGAPNLRRSHHLAVCDENFAADR
jgi:hypothetical protein